MPDQSSSAAFPIGIVGAGAMGRGIAQVAAVAGFPVRLFDARAEAVKEACDFVGKMIERAAEKGQIDRAAAAAATARVQPVAALSELAGSKLVIEAIVEALEPKQALFRQLEDIVGDDVILATNTSSLQVTAIAVTCRRPERVAGFHFFNPVPLMKLVEVVKGVRTRPEIVDKLMKIGRQFGHAVVRVRDMPGFLVNHAGRAYGTEALRIVSEGIADPATIDDILREAAGFRMGPFELLDLTGLDVSFPVFKSIYEQFFQDPRYRPTANIEQRYTAGLYGRKTGRGFYDYQGGTIVRPPEPKVPTTKPKSVWIAPTEPSLSIAMAVLVGQAGATLDDGLTPAPESLCVVSPFGDDATTMAQAFKLDATRVIAVDPLHGLQGRRTLMTTPVTTPEMRDAAHAMFASDGAAVSVIHDSPGFVAQRVMAMIVNLGADIAQQRIAAPSDIDLGVKLGLNYPDGPLAMGDKIGPARVLAILERMHEFYRDPRYRPSPWLIRRAKLGVSLLTAET
jgi:3-hydroxybutyryl-CoA dehydrogenase